VGERTLAADNDGDVMSRANYLMQTVMVTLEHSKS